MCVLDGENTCEIASYNVALYKLDVCITNLIFIIL